MRFPSFFASSHNSLSEARRGSAVVSLLLSTSNHNNLFISSSVGGVVSLLLSTSNHNRRGTVCSTGRVVSLLLSTSNHNYRVHSNKGGSLFHYYFLHQTTTPWWSRCSAGGLFHYYFLHQTTTLHGVKLLLQRCFIITFYIKPQQLLHRDALHLVVSLLLSTSNHNFTMLRLYAM